MKKLRKLLHRCRQKQKKPNGFTLGFTLIELLVAIAMGGLIITPILGLVISLLNSDRQEQVKGRGEQELQAALDYIARDLQQAVYIYDAPGVAAIQNQLPSPTNSTPVLVFWKRKFLDADDPIDRDRDGSINLPGEQVGCLNQIVNNAGTNICDGQDYFVFALVAYYLVNNDPGGTWSNAMRIDRWEIRDGITTTNANHPNRLPARATDNNNFNDTNTYLAYPNFAFQSFNLATGNTTALAMNTWMRYQLEDGNFNPNMTTLVDYIDESTFDNNADLDRPTCGTNQSMVPDFDATGFPASLKTGSFYVCVPTLTNPGAGFDPPRKPIAEVHIRANARLRMENNATYSKARKAFFPSSSITVQGVGFVGN